MTAKISVEPVCGPSSLVQEPALTIESQCNPRKTYHVRRQPSDIDACVSFSLVRCAISMISIFLVITDIPRTGLYLNLLYPKVGLDTAMYYGPYAYTIAHMNRTNQTDVSSSILGFAGTARFQDLHVWSYKFDSLSIPTRALAEHLNVSSYPSCVLYREQCPTTMLGVGTVFRMLDDLITAIDRKYFSNKTLRSLPAVFYTTSNWADRLHHVILGTFGYRFDFRIHAVYRFVVKAGASGGVNVCEQHNAAESHHSLVCKAPIKWLCNHPFLGAKQHVALSENIRLRVAALQQRYPNAELDMTMITTRNELQSRHYEIIPTVYYRSDNTEITTFIRGRDCRSGSSCTTIFIDDYRYERGTLETSLESFHRFLAILRIVSQTYVWLRLALLFFICYRTRVAESKYRHKSVVVKLFVVFKTLAKIPCHSIIYTSWLPIIGYSIAYFADSGLTHLVSENFWSTTKGFFSFHLMRYIMVASIQMRNVWIIALVWKCTITFYNRFFTAQKEVWQPHHGLLVFRGLFMSATSGLTIFTFLRALRFRDSRVLSFEQVQRNRGVGNQFLAQRPQKHSPDFGYPLDIKVITVALAIVIGSVHFVRLTYRRSAKAFSRSFFCHTFYIPLSTGVLFPASALVPFWYVGLIRAPESESRSLGQEAQPTLDHLRVIPSQTHGVVLPFRTTSTRRHCDTCDFESSPPLWRPVQGCQKHETLFDIGRRSVESQSMIRLMHVGVLSDPIVFFQLRFLGKQLYVYRLRDCTSAVTAGGKSSKPHGEDTNENNGRIFLSPIPLLRRGTEDSHGDLTSHAHAEYDLVARVNSTRVPLTLLVDCG